MTAPEVYIQHVEQEDRAFDALGALIGKDGSARVITAFAESKYGSRRDPYGDRRIFSETGTRIGELLRQETNQLVRALVGSDDTLFVFDALEDAAFAWVRTQKAIALERNPDAPAIAAVAYIQKGLAHGLEGNDFERATDTWATWKKDPIQRDRVALYASLVTSYGAMTAHAIESRWHEIHTAIRNLQHSNGFDLDTFLVQTIGRIMGGVPREKHASQDAALKTFIYNSHPLRQHAALDRRLLRIWVEYNLVRAKQMDDRTLDIAELEAQTSHVLTEVTRYEGVNAV